MKTFFYNLYSNSWKYVIIGFILFGLYSFAHPRFTTYFNPPKTKFQEIKTDLYSLSIPKSWHVYDDSRKSRVTYSDLGSNSFTTGHLSVYRFAQVNTGDLTQSCETELSQVSTILSDSARLENSNSKYEKSNNRCVITLSIISTPNLDSTLAKQYHTYLVYAAGEDLLLFELISPNEKLSPDLSEIYSSIKVSTTSK